MTAGCAYNSIYAGKAMASMGSMIETAVWDIRQDPDEFFGLFISSGYAALFASGDVRTLAGMSGAELAYIVMEKSGIRAERAAQRFSSTQSAEMRAGRSLAYYQWKTAMPFEEIIRAVHLSEIMVMCVPGRTEEDLFSEIDSRVRSFYADTRLKTIRIRCGMSQRQLADASGIPLRTIQQYEQRQKNINKAQFAYLARLASALSCDPMDLFERSVSGD